MTARNPLPEWHTGMPDKPGTYIGFSDLPERRDEVASLYTFDGQRWQHWTGFFDGAVTHWMPTDLPEPDEADK